jgi:hypothetical protein
MYIAGSTFILSSPRASHLSDLRQNIRWPHWRTLESSKGSGHRIVAGGSHGAGSNQLSAISYQFSEPKNRQLLIGKSVS